MPVRSTLKSLAQEVTEVSKRDDDNVADISRQQDIIWWVLFHDPFDRMFRVVLRGETIVIVRTVPKLGVHRRENLF